MKTHSNPRGFSFDRIEHLPLPELAQALRSQVNVIIAKWVEQVREVLPETKRLSLDELTDNLPSILPAMADALAASDDAGKRALLERSPLQRTSWTS